MDKALSDIMTSSKPRSTRIVHTPKGFILNYPHETDVNIFFDRSFYPQLKSVKLEPSFSKATEKHRIAIIPNITYETYLKDENILLAHLKEHNDTNIVHLEKYLTGSSKKNIKIFMASKTAQTQIISQGKIKLFNEIFRVEEYRNSEANSRPPPRQQNLPTPYRRFPPPGNISQRGVNP